MKDSGKTQSMANGTDYGIRKVSHMNQSFIVTLPKDFVQNKKTGKSITAVRRTMLEDGSLNLVPVREKDESAEFVIM